MLEKYCGAMLLGAMLAEPFAAHAQSYPDRPIKIVVPYAAGGAVDIVARTIGQPLSEALKQPAIVDNRPGASANIGMEMVAKAAPERHRDQHGVVSEAHVGGAPAISDLLGERISFMPINPVEVIAHIHAGKLRALAVSSDMRLALLPDVPTVSEAGLPGYEASVLWSRVIKSAGIQPD